MLTQSATRGRAAERGGCGVGRCGWAALWSRWLGCRADSSVGHARSPHGLGHAAACASPRPLGGAAALARLGRGGFAEHGLRGCARVQLSELEAQAEFFAALGESKNCFLFITERIVYVHEMIRNIVTETVGNSV